MEKIAFHIYTSLQVVLNIIISSRILHRHFCVRHVNVATAQLLLNIIMEFQLTHSLQHFALVPLALLSACSVHNFCFAALSVVLPLY